MSFELGLFILRVVIGAVIIAHGTQKLFGWFGGFGFYKTIGMLNGKGLRPAWFWALLAVLGETGGGLLLMLGFLTPLGAIGLFASMLMAVLKFHWQNGFFAMKGGYEYALVLGIVGLVIGMVGPGRYSLDALLGLTIPPLFFWLGIIASIIVDSIGLLISRQSADAATQQTVRTA